MPDGPKDALTPFIYNGDKLRFMENAVLLFLQSLFGGLPSDGLDPDAGPEGFSLHYDEDVTKSRIDIRGQMAEGVENVDTRPLIIVARGAVNFVQASINASIGSANTSLARQRHAVIMSGSVGISCYSREQLEADRIAEICASSIEFFQPIIRKYGFLEIRSASIGQRALIKADSRADLFVTPVMVKASVTQNWTRTFADPVRLRKIFTEFVLQQCSNT